jgi:uncharacterized glyoxalase superfamily protein PhnB
MDAEASENKTVANSHSATDVVTSRLYCRPVFAVANARASVQYYCEALGFHHDWSYPREGETLICAQVSRGEAEIIVWVTPDVASPGRLYIVPHEEDQLDVLHAEMVAAGGKVTNSPKPQPWAPYGFIVEDLDRNQLFFAGDPPQAL